MAILESQSGATLEAVIAAKPTAVFDEKLGAGLLRRTSLQKLFITV